MCNVMIFNSFVKDIEMIFATVLHFRVKFAGKRCKYVESCIMSKFLGVFCGELILRILK